MIINDYRSRCRLGFLLLYFGPSYVVLCNVFKDVAMKELLAIENNASY